MPRAVLFLVATKVFEVSRCEQVIRAWLYLGFLSGLSGPLLVFIELLGLLFWLEEGDLSKALIEKDEGVPKFEKHQE